MITNKRNIKIGEHLLYMSPASEVRQQLIKSQFRFIAIVEVVKKFEVCCECKVIKVLVSHIKKSEHIANMLNCHYNYLDKLVDEVNL